MKATQKLRVTVEDITYETTAAKLDPKLADIAAKLEASGLRECNATHVTSGAAVLFVQVAYIGPIPKARPAKLFGHDTAAFMAKQYK
jgi:hypothetical protein